MQSSLQIEQIKQIGRAPLTILSLELYICTSLKLTLLLLNKLFPMFWLVPIMKQCLFVTICLNNS